MEDKEFDMCNKKCKSFLKYNRYGKMVSKELQFIFESIFREGYQLGKLQRKVKNGK